MAWPDGCGSASQDLAVANSLKVPLQGSRGTLRNQCLGAGQSRSSPLGRQEYVEAQREGAAVAVMLILIFTFICGKTM